MWEPETRADELAWEMSSSGEVTLQDAVDAFELRVPDFPGATRSPLSAGDGISTSYALALLLPLRDELTAEQQAALDDYLASGEPAGRVTADGVIVDRRAGWRRPSSTRRSGRSPWWSSTVRRGRSRSSSPPHRLSRARPCRKQVKRLPRTAVRITLVPFARGHRRPRNPVTPRLYGASQGRHPRTRTHVKGSTTP